MANSTVNFNDGEALVHTDLNNVSLSLDNRSALANYAQLVRNYCLITSSTYATVYAAGLQAVGMDVEPTLTLGSGTVGISPDRWYVGLGVGPHSGDPEDLVLAALDMPATSTVVPANATGSQRTDTLSIPATQAALFVAGSSETRYFEDAVTGALSTQSVNKLYTASVTLTYTAGGAAPAGHATIATFTVPNASSTPTLQYRHWIPMGSPNGVQILAEEFLPASVIASKSYTGGARITSAMAIRTSLGRYIPKGAFVTSFSVRIESDADAVGSLSMSTWAANSIPTTAFVESNPVTLPPIRSAATSSAPLAGDGTNFVSYSLGPFVHGSIAGGAASYFLYTSISTVSGTDDVYIYDMNIRYIPYR